MIVLPMESNERTPVVSTAVFLSLLLMMVCACGTVSAPKEPKKIRIGFSQCTGDLKWRRATLEGVKRELAFHPGSELIYKNAEDNSELQVRQIKELSAQDIDILLVSPNEAEPLTAVVEEVFNKGIPVVVIDRRIASDMYTAFVGANNFEIGKMAGNYVSNLFKPGSRIVEIIGLKGSTSSNERRQGFTESLKNNPQLRIQHQVYGNWLQETSFQELSKIKDLLSPHDIVFAQNDPMALGAWQVYKKLGIEDSATFIGVDGLSGPGGGIDLVSDKKLKATLLNPTGGEEAIQIAFRILNKESFSKENTLSTVVIDSTNVRIMKLQTDKINTQQKDIENQQDILLQQQQLSENQHMVINIFIGALILVLTLGGISVYALLKNRKITRRLSLQNQEILSQRNQLIEMTAKAKEATDAKFNFFTNISHEFRTPLTLILAPLEDCLSSPKLHFTHKNNLEVVHKNAMRLLRLINQLMDYRKIEEQKMQLQVSENDIVPFVTEITDAFQVISRQKSISFKVNSKVTALPVWFDVHMLDKVLFNLLSNAFKFTPDNGGVINVFIGKNAAGTMAVIKVEDFGVGMHPEEAEHAFDLFYQGNTAKRNGTGLGLSLSRELIHLHHGAISLRSEKWKGTLFEISLPLGKDHFQPCDFAPASDKRSISYEEVKIYSKEISPMMLNADYVTAAPEKQHSLLIIEDNDDLRLFLKNRLGELYDIYEAENGRVGLSMAFDIVPDLIISDIILPGNDGLFITETIKQDIRTSHIPLILLTAKNSIEEQIQGIRLQADAFIVKPFNVEYLIETIKNLLKSRASLREHYTSELPSEARNNSWKKIDRKFISEFTAIIESNVSNENFSVEDICREIGISRVQLNRKVKALLDYNVNDYLLTVRLQKAKFLLANESMSIFEVACKVGFSSQAYFATVFKSKFSITPTEFRERRKMVKISPA